MLKALKLRLQKKFENTSSNNENIKKRKTQIDIDFVLQNELVYRQNNDDIKLCISKICEKEVFEMIHDRMKHTKHQKSYQKLTRSIYISRMTRKLHFYIKHCLSWQLNQIKRHKSYEELMFITNSTISFQIIVMNFILIISNEMNTILIISNKVTRRKTFIFDKIIYSIEQGVNLIFERLLITNGGIFQKMISKKNFKFMSEFGNQLFKRLNTKLLTSIAYHPQTNDLFERINQTIEITLKFIFIENSNLNVVEMLSTLQISLNNAFTTTIEYSSNELMYEFKIRNVLTTLFVNVNERVAITKITVDMTIDFNKIKQFIDLRLLYVKKTANATAYANAKTKIYYDKKHQSLLLNSKDEIYFKLHHGYKLSSVFNKKLNNQQTEPFLIKRRINRLIYELDLLFKGNIHSIISIAQLKFAEKEKNSYDKYKSNHFDFVEIEKNTEKGKFYKVDKIVKKRIRKFDGIDVT